MARDLSQFLFFTGLFRNSSDGGAFPGSTLSGFEDFGMSCTLGMGSVCGTSSLCDYRHNLVEKIRGRDWSVEQYEQMRCASKVWLNVM